MSHFAVLVVGDDVEGQLAPYDENIQVDEYETEVDQSQIDRAIKFYTDHPEHVSEQTLKAMGSLSVEEWLSSDPDQRTFMLVTDYFDGRCTYHDGKYFALSQYNPDSKWDWYAIGGRWRGFFKLKEGATKTREMVGAPGVFDNPPAHDVDVVHKGDVDWDAMRHAGRAASEKEWDEIHRVADPFMQGFKTWVECLADNGLDPDKTTDEYDPEFSKKAVEKAREQYHLQKAVKALQDARKDRDFPFLVSYDDVLTSSRNEYGDTGAQGAVMAYAYVKDGEWHQRGQMRMFGMSTDEMDAKTWSIEFNEMIDSLPDDATLTLVDCHI